MRGGEVIEDCILSGLAPRCAAARFPPASSDLRRCGREKVEEITGGDPDKTEDTCTYGNVLRL